MSEIKNVKITNYFKTLIKGLDKITNEYKLVGANVCQTLMVAPYDHKLVNKYLDDAGIIVLKDTQKGVEFVRNGFYINLYHL